jgi:hypothetical protein
MKYNFIVIGNWSDMVSSNMALVMEGFELSSDADICVGTIQISLSLGKEVR